MSVKHFLSLMDFSKDELNALVKRAIELKKMHNAGENYAPLNNKTLGMIFDKSSTRTRVSFEVAMAHFGGHALFLSPRDTQLGRGEPIEDSAKVLSSMVDALMVRTYEHSTLVDFAAASSVPVINGLTDYLHPCQVLADMQTFFECCGSIQGKTVAWLGDGNNMCHSYIHAAMQFDFKLNISCPENYAPNKEILKKAKNSVELFVEPKKAVKDSSLIVTDVWASMGKENEQKAREDIFYPFQVNQEIIDLANDEVIFMHCLPAYRGKEVTSEVIDGKHSVVWDEAENRLHAQKALLEKLLV
ncbi:MAG: ornithine carbamoyltransferase [Pseudomonadota bacterium]